MILFCLCLNQKKHFSILKSVYPQKLLKMPLNDVSPTSTLVTYLCTYFIYLKSTFQKLGVYQSVVQTATKNDILKKLRKKTQPPT